MIGETISHYRILEKLGEGGMGVVYRAEDTRLGRMVALKFLPADVNQDENARHRFLREARAASALDHPNIYTIHEVDETADGRAFICMAYYDGESLQSKLRGTPLPVDEAVAIAAQVADGLSSAHAAGIVHRDIKPENVMITRDGVAKIVDFGLVKRASDARLTTDGAALGTVAYMSPEQVRGEDVDARSDLFSLGAVLYEMLTGRPPFRGDHPASVLYSITNDPVDAPSHTNHRVPAELDRIVVKALAKDLGSRYASASQLSADLRGLGLATVAATPARAGRRLLWTLALAAIAVVVALGVIWTQRRSATDIARVTHDTPAGAPASRRTTSQLTFGSSLEDWPAWSPDGARLAYSAEADGFKHLFVWSRDSGNAGQVTRGDFDDIQAAWSPDGNAIAFVRANTAAGKLSPTDVLGYFNESAHVYVLDVAAGATRKLIDNAFNPSYSPDGSTILVDAAWAGARRIWTTDARGRNPKQLTTDASEAVVHVSPAWSPDGTRVVYCRVQNTRADIEVFDLATQTTVRLTDDWFNDLDPVWSPSGRYVYFSSNRGGGLNLWRVAVDGSTPRAPEQVTTGAGDDLQPSISPDGSRLAFVALGLNSDLWRLPLDPKSGKPTRAADALIATTREDSRAAWSPDGSTIAFNSDRLGDMNLWLHSLLDGSERRLTTGAGGDYQANWSPDGQRIAFFSSRSGNLDIWTVGLADSAMRQLTSDPGLDVNPFFSPDGTMIAFQSDRGGRSELWVMQSDGTLPRPVASVEANGHFVCWRDSRRIMFASGWGADRVIYNVDVENGALETMPKIKSGAHMSFSPDGTLVLDVTGHKALWINPLSGAEPTKIFEFDSPDIRIDYPRWSPDGRWAVFDRVAPQGGDIWSIEGLE